MIKRKGKRFYLEVFNPEHDWKFLGMVACIRIPDSVPVFITHVKDPERHFYIKGLGYPINDELLRMLKNAGVGFIVIPERGKRGFKAYIVETEKYLGGCCIGEPLTERQRYVPLSVCTEIPVDESMLNSLLYGRGVEK